MTLLVVIETSLLFWNCI